MAYLNWNEAPEWATHIVADADLPCIQCWAEKVGDAYYCENWRKNQRASFHMLDDDTDDEPGIWLVSSARPPSLMEGE
ncbi:hypothetical protein BTW15_01375 [Pseudomonas syringae pv. tomato]|uniref:DUF551 domain-containing protein n=1 Tax=Pseudomonas syringae pv. tomato TaxID=323 RepID=A0AB36L2L5_PSEUB|nr:hypothetical protein [Pseudomonas syringae group genomosp. 3]MBX6510495.1 hypothetical protein [Pseudomonas syringae pv. tomato]OPE62027.1 hypothetical protein BTW15_01375 [Pseudomonas syringae pv. tomato]TES74675.1 hypothetical protein E2N89_23710 [Pseudomonas syringae pv. tomato]